MARRLLCGWVLAALLGAALGWRSEAGPPVDLPPAPVVGHPAPDFSLPALGGGTISLRELRGKPVFLNFWATWCPPCREEMPDIERVYRRYGTSASVVGMNLTGSERAPERVSAFMRAQGLSFPIALDAGDEVARDYQVRSIPTSFFIDARGVIRAKFVGPMTAAAMEDALRQAGMR